MSLNFENRVKAGPRPVRALPTPPRPVETSPDELPVMPITERAMALGAQGKHMPTGFDTLDESTRGGPRPGDVVVVGGAPGAGKTTWLMNLGVHYARQGYRVGVLACDEGPDGLLIRVGQALGFTREDLEAADEPTREAFAAALDPLAGLSIFDADDGHTVEGVAARLKVAAGDAPVVLIVDSVQTARASGSDDADSPRERVDAVVRALKRAAKTGILVLASCELNRGAYRSKNSAEACTDLSAFKESGGIEYGATVALVLRNVADTPDQVDATFAKNRLRGPGAKEVFRMSLDRHKAAFKEIERPDEPDPSDRRAEARNTRDATIQRRIVEELRKRPVEGLPSKNDIVRRLKGFGRKPVLDAISDLFDAGEIVLEDGRFKTAVEVPGGGS